jgi:hypothetical protein
MGQQLLPVLELRVVLKEVEFVASGEKGLLVYGVQMFVFMVFYFEQLVQFLLGLLDAVLEVGDVLQFLTEVTRLSILRVFHEKNIMAIRYYCLNSLSRARDGSVPSSGLLYFLKQVWTGAAIPSKNNPTPTYYSAQPTTQQKPPTNPSSPSAAPRSHAHSPTHRHPYNPTTTKSNSLNDSTNNCAKKNK